MTETKHYKSGILKQIIREQQSGRIVVFTNGCFDLLHPGHVSMLQAARCLGDVLVVAINSDESIRRLKGDGRPVFAEKERVCMLEALSCVDYVVVYPEDTPIPLLEILRPEILVKGAEYAPDQVVGKDLVEQFGGRIERVPNLAGLSTTTIIKRIIRLNTDSFD